jgi:pimeloyl-ACP methyl ester carboxylesterase
MAQTEPQFLRVGDGASAGAPGRRIAYLTDAGTPGKSPGVMWLSGLKSEMTSTKASVLAAWAAQHGHPCTRFDYSGHGQSPGRFEEGTVGAWLEEALAVFKVTRGPQVLVGSSMGGYIALLVLRTLMRDAPAEAARIKGLLLIAPAWDMTERLMWARFPESVRREVMEKGVYQRPSKYGDGDYAISLRLIEEGRNHLIGDAPFDPGRPIHVLHGLLDPDVPWEHTLDLVAHLTGDHVQVSAVPDGEHRLSRPEDLDLMIRALEGLAGVSYAK